MMPLSDNGGSTAREQQRRAATLEVQGASVANGQSPSEGALPFVNSPDIGEGSLPLDRNVVKDARTTDNISKGTNSNNAFRIKAGWSGNSSSPLYYFARDQRVYDGEEMKLKEGDLLSQPRNDALPGASDYHLLGQTGIDHLSPSLRLSSNSASSFTGSCFESSCTSTASSLSSPGDSPSLAGSPQRSHSRHDRSDCNGSPPDSRNNGYRAERKSRYVRKRARHSLYDGAAITREYLLQLAVAMRAYLEAFCQNCSILEFTEHLSLCCCAAFKAPLVLAFVHDMDTDDLVTYFPSGNESWSDALERFFVGRSHSSLEHSLEVIRVSGKYGFLGTLFRRLIDAEWSTFVTSPLRRSCTSPRMRGALQTRRNKHRLVRSGSSDLQTTHHAAEKSYVSISLPSVVQKGGENADTDDPKDGAQLMRDVLLNHSVTQALEENLLSHCRKDAKNNSSGSNTAQGDNDLEPGQSYGAFLNKSCMGPEANTPNIEREAVGFRNNKIIDCQRKLGELRSRRGRITLPLVRSLIDTYSVQTMRNSKDETPKQLNSSVADGVDTSEYPEGAKGRFLGDRSVGQGAWLLSTPAGSRNVGLESYGLRAFPRDRVTLPLSAEPCVNSRVAAVGSQKRNKLENDYGFGAHYPLEWCGGNKMDHLDSEIDATERVSILHTHSDSLLRSFLERKIPRCLSRPFPTGELSFLYQDEDKGLNIDTSAAPVAGSEEIRQNHSSDHYELEQERDMYCGESPSSLNSQTSSSRSFTRRSPSQLQSPELVHRSSPSTRKLRRSQLVTTVQAATDFRNNRIENDGKRPSVEINILSKVGDNGEDSFEKPVATRQKVSQSQTGPQNAPYGVRPTFQTIPPVAVLKNNSPVPASPTRSGRNRFGFQHIDGPVNSNDFSQDVPRFSSSFEFPATTLDRMLTRSPLAQSQKYSTPRARSIPSQIPVLGDAEKGSTDATGVAEGCSSVQLRSLGLLDSQGRCRRLSTVFSVLYGTFAPTLSPRTPECPTNAPSDRGHQKTTSVENYQISLAFFHTPPPPSSGTRGSKGLQHSGASSSLSCAPGSRHEESKEKQVNDNGLSPIGKKGSIAALPFPPLLKLPSVSTRSSHKSSIFYGIEGNEGVLSNGILSTKHSSPPDDRAVLTSVHSSLDNTVSSKDTSETTRPSFFPRRWSDGALVLNQEAFQPKTFGSRLHDSIDRFRRGVSDGVDCILKAPEEGIVGATFKARNGARNSFLPIQPSLYPRRFIRPLERFMVLDQTADSSDGSDSAAQQASPSVLPRPAAALSQEHSYTLPLEKEASCDTVERPSHFKTARQWSLPAINVIAASNYSSSHKKSDHKRNDYYGGGIMPRHDPHFYGSCGKKVAPYGFSTRSGQTEGDTVYGSEKRTGKPPPLQKPSSSVHDGDCRTATKRTVVNNSQGAMKDFNLENEQSSKKLFGERKPSVPHAVPVLCRPLFNVQGLSGKVPIGMICIFSPADDNTLAPERQRKLLNHVANQTQGLLRQVIQLDRLRKEQAKRNLILRFYRDVCKNMNDRDRTVMRLLHLVQTVMNAAEVALFVADYAAKDFICCSGNPRCQGLRLSWNDPLLGPCLRSKQVFILASSSTTATPKILPSSASPLSRGWGLSPTSSLKGVKNANTKENYEEHVPRETQPQQSDRAGLSNVEKSGKGNRATSTCRRFSSKGCLALEVKAVIEAESINIDYDLVAKDIITRSCMCVPLMNAEGVVMAIIEVINRFPSTFKMKDRGVYEKVPPTLQPEGSLKKHTAHEGPPAKGRETSSSSQHGCSATATRLNGSDPYSTEIYHPDTGSGSETPKAEKGDGAAGSLPNALSSQRLPGLISGPAATAAGLLSWDASGGSSIGPLLEPPGTVSDNQRQIHLPPLRDRLANLDSVIAFSREDTALLQALADEITLVYGGPLSRFCMRVLLSAQQPPLVPIRSCFEQAFMASSGDGGRCHSRPMAGTCLPSWLDDRKVSRSRGHKSFPIKKESYTILSSEGPTRCRKRQSLLVAVEAGDRVRQAYYNDRKKFSHGSTDWQLSDIHARTADFKEWRRRVRRVSQSYEQFIMHKVHEAAVGHPNNCAPNIEDGGGPETLVVEGSDIQGLPGRVSGVGSSPVLGASLPAETTTNKNTSLVAEKQHDIQRLDSKPTDVEGDSTEKPNANLTDLRVSDSVRLRPGRKMGKCFPYRRCFLWRYQVARKKLLAVTLGRTLPNIRSGPPLSPLSLSCPRSDACLALTSSVDQESLSVQQKPTNASSLQRRDSCIMERRVKQKYYTRGILNNHPSMYLTGPGLCTQASKRSARMFGFKMTGKLPRAVLEKATSPPLTTIINGWGISWWSYSLSIIEQVFLQSFDFFNIFGTLHLVFPERLSRFLHVIAGAYHRENPYHNFFHGIQVYHIAWLLLSRYRLAQYLRVVDTFGTLIGALCHDVDHPGVTNDFFVAVQHPAALLYNDVSVLENHHCAFTFRLLAANADCDFRVGMSESDMRAFRRAFIRGVLATDMQLHANKLAAFSNRVQRHNLGAELLSVTSAEDRNLIMEMIVHASDISNPMTPAPYFKRWASLIVEEFNLQCDREATLGIDITAFMNCRTEKARVDCQIGFVEFIVLPTWRSMALLVSELKSVVEQGEANARYWHHCAQILSKWTSSMLPPKPFSDFNFKLACFKRNHPLPQLNTSAQGIITLKPPDCHGDTLSKRDAPVLELNPTIDRS